jgi:putative endonuclease
MFTTYIIFSETLQKFYIGFTSGDVNTRIYKHLANHKGFTAKAKDWAIVYSEQFTTKSEALAREKQLKSWKSNIRIREFILRSSTQ